MKMAHPLIYYSTLIKLEAGASTDPGRVRGV